MAEFYFFEEFDARFNLVAFDYLAYPTEVFIDIWEAYPVLQVLPGTACSARTITWLLRHGARGRHQTLSSTLRRRVGPFAAYAALLIAAIAWYPTDALSLSSNRVENELVQNGYSSFFRAAATNRDRLPRVLCVARPGANLDLLVSSLGAGGGEFTRLAEGRLDRRFPGACRRARSPERRRRVERVVRRARFSRLYGSERDLTPNFDAYAQRGLWFSRTYASGPARCAASRH